MALAAGLLLVIGANAHLLYAAVTSEPACVLHLRPGDGGAERGRFIAARSACTPQRQGSEQRGTS
jgi:hypothetical protein